MQASSTSSTSSSRPAAPTREANAQGGAGDKPGELFSTLMSQAGAQRKALQAMQEQAEQRAAQEAKSASRSKAESATRTAAKSGPRKAEKAEAAEKTEAADRTGRSQQSKEPSPDDVAGMVVPPRLGETPATPAGEAAVADPLSAAKRQRGANAADDAAQAGSGEAEAGIRGIADAAPASAADVAVDAAANGIGVDAAGATAEAAATRGGTSTATAGEAASAGGARHGAAAQAQAALTDPAGLQQARAEASHPVGGTTAAMLAAAGRLAAGAGDGADAGGAARLRGSGREGAAGLGAPGAGERGGSSRRLGGRGDDSAAEAGAYRMLSGNASAEAAGSGAGAADAAAAQATGTSATAHGTGGNDGGLFALTMNQGPESPSLAASRQESMTETMQAAIDVPVDHEAFAEAFARQSATLVVQGSGQAQISVTPQDMGPIRIAISMEADGAWLDIAAGHAETRAAIEASIPHLRQMLADQGVRLSDWRLRDDGAGGPRQASGGEGDRQPGHPGDPGHAGDNSRSDASQQRSGADAAAHPGQGHGESRQRAATPSRAWAAPAGPLTTSPQPAIGPGAASGGRRLDLYA